MKRIDPNLRLEESRLKSLKRLSWRQQDPQTSMSLGLSRRFHFGASAVTGSRRRSG